MAMVVRRGDPNAAGGLVIGPCANSVLVNGRPVSVPADYVSSHPCCSIYCPLCCSALTTMGSLSVLAEGKPIVYVGSPDTCFHPRAFGSMDVIVGTS